MQITLNNALNQLDANPVQLFARVMEHGMMAVEIYRPCEADLQTPHRQDELYVVISGSGEFVNNGVRSTFSHGDVLFVPVGIEHKFENFTNDFVTWVIFYGPAGGKKQ